MREIILADHAGFCFGVQRAVTNALDMKNPKGRVLTFGELIHNSDVVKKLEQSGIHAISEENFGSVTKDDTILIRSHGVTKAKLEELGTITDKVLNLTCPYVTNIQRKVSEYHAKGYRIIILGDASHPEVIGINGWCGNSALISKGGDVDFTIPTKCCVVAQTTERQSNWEKLIGTLATRTKEMVAINTICAATEQRQTSTTKLSKEVDAMVVIGGKHSSNTTKLYEICKTNCNHTFFVENAEELKQYIEELKGYEKIGVTAGASTPDWIIKEAIELL
ncbi:4-hydroxy-3-methylbut-2-enyl diphosphate reductase [Proteiniclasticum sp. QWL-01]|uniref:4-hydroxy-3-methylbut-2-enyl diphosphate reductase n=1 Tax=Proteiniclasticum sp. QWL-01 TaxID=3036945 RepID=UPI00240FE2D9|nr:4-hydroxy-3-methylbut-2-enyl diphosphate reductase [Proteiniclasticum sp. QWL-01]WFF71443.1 4-hydroxy-3-methylbut-2-enyl diphosphate reductase [Proteiniclasticum sp. QWL-01]